jgi:hypothetical protein
MNVGEWLAQYMPHRPPTTYRRPHDNEDMVEVAACCYLNRTAYDAGYAEPVARSVQGKVIDNVPIGNSLTPWRIWLLAEGNEWTRKWSWL